MSFLPRDLSTASNMSYLVPRDPSIKCWDDRVKLNSPRTKNLVQLGLDEVDKEDGITINGKLRVYLRLKPSSSEFQSYTLLNESTLETEAPKTSVSFKNVTNGVGKLVHKFTFTKILKQDATQSTVFEKCVLDNLKKFLTGENYLILAYGTTNAGKTFTMQGTIEQPGVIPRALDFVFTSLKENIETICRYHLHRSDELYILSEDQLKKEMDYKKCILSQDLSKYQRNNESTYFKTESTTQSIMDFSESYENSTFQEMESNLGRSTDVFEVPSDKYAVWVSMVEIYNEQVYDLLDIREKGAPAKLGYGEDDSGKMFIRNLRHISVCSGHEAFQIFQFGRANLHLARTALNQKSSRSHCICTITLARFLDYDHSPHAIISKFSFCDLAGIERAKKTLNVGNRLIESKSINTSLLTLVKCLTIIKENQNKKEKKIIPYRESKLTRLFRDAMMGKDKFSMIVNVTTEQNLFDETLNVLKFSALAQQIIPKHVFAKPRRLSPIKKSRFSQMVKKAGHTSHSLMIDWDTTTIVDETSKSQSSHAYEALLELVDQLKKEVAQEKARADSIECEVRKELTTKFSEMFKEERESHKNIFESETARLKEVHERKRQQIMQYYEKLEQKRKRKRMDNSDENIDPEIFEELKDTKKELEYMKRENDSLKDRVHDLSEDNNNLQTKTSQLKFEMVELTRQLKLKERMSQASLTGEDSLVSELKTQLADSQSKIAELKSLLDEAAEDAKEMTRRNESLAEENEQLEADLVAEREKLTDKLAEVEDLQKVIAEKSERIEELENTCEKSDREVTALKIAREGMEKQIQELKSRAEISEKELNVFKNHVCVKKEPEDLELGLEASETESNNARSHLECLKKEIEESDFELELASPAEESNLFRNCPECAEKENEKLDILAKLGEYAELLKNFKNDLGNEKLELELKIDSYEKEMEKLRNCQECAQKENEKSVLEKKIKSQQEELKLLRSCQECALKEKEKSELELKIDSYEKELEKLRKCQECAQKENEKSVLEKKIKSQQEELKLLRSCQECTQKENEKSVLEVKIKWKQEELDRLRNCQDCAQKENEKSEMAVKIKSYEEEVGKLKDCQDCLKKEKEKSELQVQLESWESESDKGCQECLTKEKQKSELQVQLQEYQRKLENFQCQECIKKEEGVADMKKEVEIATLTLKMASSNYEEVKSNWDQSKIETKKRNEELEMRIESLEKENRRLKEQFRKEDHFSNEADANSPPENAGLSDNKDTMIVVTKGIETSEGDEPVKQRKPRKKSLTKKKAADNASSAEDSPFVRAIKKPAKQSESTPERSTNQSESTPERLAKQIEKISIANSQQKSTRKGVNLLEESIHPCTVKKTRGGRKGKKEKEVQKEEEDKEEVKETRAKRCNKKLFLENDFDNIGDLDSSFVEPEIPKLRPRKK